MPALLPAAAHCDGLERDGYDGTPRIPQEAS